MANGMGKRAKGRAKKKEQTPAQIALEVTWQLKGNIKHKKALEGKLSEKDLDPFRRRQHDEDDGLRAFLSKLRFLRMRGAELASMPPEVIANLDAAIAVLNNAHAFQNLSFRLLHLSGKRSPRAATA